jgi:CDP-diacylglycerol---glycerol-3-phosphate 3-phosphatidyltransferase
MNATAACIKLSARKGWALMHWPMVITWLRIALVPVAVVGNLLAFDKVLPFTAGICVLACLSDWLDGYLARALKQTSEFGKFLDPVADKLLVCAMVTLLCFRLHHPLLAVFSMIIIMREIGVSALREWLARVKAGSTIEVSRLAKWKTTMQMSGIVSLCWCLYSFNPWIWSIGMGAFGIATLLSVVTLYYYLRHCQSTFS